MWNVENREQKFPSLFIHLYLSIASHWMDQCACIISIKIEYWLEKIINVISRYLCLYYFLHIDTSHIRYLTRFLMLHELRLKAP